MLDRIHGEIVFECDGYKCNESLETGTSNFSEAKEMLDAAGWQTRKVKNEWNHICLFCLEDEIEGSL